MRRAFTFVEFVAVVAILSILAAILMPVFNRTNCGNSRFTSCQSNLKMIGLGVMQYALDYDEKFPPAKTNSKTIWATSLRPYVKSWQVFDCPSAPIPVKQKFYVKPPTGGTTDYFYNKRLSTLTQTKFATPQVTILSGDGRANVFSSSIISALPVEWLSSADAPSRRHPIRKNLEDQLFKRNLDRANYLFTDGHVKSALPEKITLDNPKASGKFTFIPR